MRSRRGYALLLALVWVSFLFSLLLASGQVYLSARRLSAAHQATLAAFYLAQAGLERGKWLLTSDPAFAFTDPPYGGGSAGRVSWLILPPEAGGSAGRIYYLGLGGYKIVKEKDVSVIYSIGFVGAGPASGSAICPLKLTYSLDTGTWPPFWQQISWRRVY